MQTRPVSDVWQGIDSLSSESAPYSASFIDDQLATQTVVKNTEREDFSQIFDFIVTYQKQRKCEKLTLCQTSLTGYPDNLAHPQRPDGGQQ